MADVTLKLTIDGKEAIQTLNLTDEQLKRLRGDLENIKNQKVKTQIEAEMKGMNPEQIRALYSNLKKELQEKIKMSIPDQELGELKTKLSAVEEAMQGVAEQGEKSTGGLIDGFGKLGLAINGVQQVLSIVGSVIGKPLEVAGQFEKYAVTLKVMLGSEEEASKRMAEYVKIGATTPFELSEVVELGNGLQALGKYSEETVIMMGDLAAASGKPLEMVKNAYTKLVTGEVGMAKQMFRDLLITAGDWEKATGKANASAEEMEKALPKILAMKGFGGMMEEQSKTLEGVKSNFEDTISGLMNDVGQDLLPLAKDVFGILISGIDVVRDNMETLKPILTVISVAVAGWMVATYGLTAGLYLKAVALKIVDTVTAMWNKTLMANPLGWVIGLVAGLVVGLGMLSKSMNEANERALENAKASEELTASTIKETDAKIKSIEQTDNLIKRYEELTSKTNLTVEEQKELDSIILRLNNKYPAIIQSGDSYNGNLERIRQQTKLNIEETKKYEEELKKLKVQLDLDKRQTASAQMNVSKDNFINALVKNTDKFVGDQVSEALFGQSETRANINAYWDSFAQDVYNSKTVDDLNKRKASFMNLITGKGFDSQELLNVKGALNEFIKSREDYLRTAGVIKDTDYGESGDANDLSKPYEIAGKTIGEITERIKKLKDAQDGLLPKSKELLENQKEIAKLENAIKTDKGGGGKTGGSTYEKDVENLDKTNKLNIKKIEDLEGNSEQKLLENKRKYYTDLILLANKYNKDKTDAMNKLLAVEVDISMREAEIEMQKLNDETFKQSDIQDNEDNAKDLEAKLELKLKKEKEFEELANRKKKFEIDGIENTFDRQRALSDYEMQTELEKYKNYENFGEMKVQLEAENSRRKMAINEAETGAQISMAKETLGILAGMVNENTALGKGIAIAQATINTYEGATKALAQGGIWGAIQMAVVIASGMAQVQKIMSTEMPQMKGYERGGVIVGENGMEIIAPAQDYASGQARLIDAVINQMGGAGENARMESLFMGFYARLESWQTNMQFQIRRGDLYSAVQKETFNRNRRAL